MTIGSLAGAPVDVAPVPVAEPPPAPFTVRLDNFAGPFDLLLSLINKHQLDITDVALSRVTDEFLGYLRGLDGPDELEQATEFLVVAATLLDLKVAGLLPQGELVDAEDVALLEARDLLFARLLQYRAFKQVAEWFANRIAAESARHYRSVRLDPQHQRSTPELRWTLTAADFAALAARAFTPRELPQLLTDHLHAPRVSVREQAATLIALLRSTPIMTFRQLIVGADQTAVVVARFLALLELYRHEAVSFDQLEPLGELTVRWSAPDWSDENLTDLGGDNDDE